jgi:hypothetical protein
VFQTGIPAFRKYDPQGHLWAAVVGSSTYEGLYTFDPGAPAIAGQ